jgi:hypothetical protein
VSGHGWWPPAGAVIVVPGPGIHCTVCGASERQGNPRAAVAATRAHRCPAGTRGAVPVCPVCLSRTEQCVTPAADVRQGERRRPVPAWHGERTALAMQAIAERERGRS